MSEKRRTWAAATAVVMLAGVFAVSREASSQQAVAAQNTVESRLTAMERRIAELEKQNTQLRTFITINGSSMTIRSAADLNFQAGSKLVLKGAQTATLEGGLTWVKGASVFLNGSGKPVARLGDQIQAPPHGGIGNIIKGASTVFVGN